jgi:hypothetical protein
MWLGISYVTELVKLLLVIFKPHISLNPLYKSDYLLKFSAEVIF